MRRAKSCARRRLRASPGGTLLAFDMFRYRRLMKINQFVPAVAVLYLERTRRTVRAPCCHGSRRKRVRNRRLFRHADTNLSDNVATPVRNTTPPATDHAMNNPNCGHGIKIIIGHPESKSLLDMRSLVSGALPKPSSQIRGRPKNEAYRAPETF